MKLSVTFALAASFSIPLLAQDTDRQTDADIEKLLPIPSRVYPTATTEGDSEDPG